jgi:biopolymer transport protein ExbB/TolQ
MMTQAATHPALSWSSQDLEQRCGVHGGRFTRVNTFLSFALAFMCTVATYAAMLPFRDRYIVQMFRERGAVQYVTVLFAYWATLILLLKLLKLRLQRRALRIEVVPSEPDFVLTAATAERVLLQLREDCEDPQNFTLLNRVEIGLSNLRNMGRISDLADVFRAQAEGDEDAMESSYSLVRGLVWAIPVLGFIGTVQGLSMAVGRFGSVLSDNVDVATLKPALQGVTAGLATAFETTLVALVAALAIQLLLTLIKRAEEQFLDDCKEFCQRKLLAKLRILPFEPVG